MSKTRTDSKWKCIVLCFRGFCSIRCSRRDDTRHRNRIYYCYDCSLGHKEFRRAFSSLESYNHRLSCGTKQNTSAKLFIIVIEFEHNVMHNKRDRLAVVTGILSSPVLQIGVPLGGGPTRIAYVVVHCYTSIRVGTAHLLNSCKCQLELHTNERLHKCITSTTVCTYYVVISDQTIVFKKIRSTTDNTQQTYDCDFG